MSRKQFTVLTSDKFRGKIKRTSALKRMLERVLLGMTTYSQRIFLHGLSNSEKEKKKGKEKHHLQTNIIKLRDACPTAH